MDFVPFFLHLLPSSTSPRFFSLASLAFLRPPGWSPGYRSAGLFLMSSDWPLGYRFACLFLMPSSWPSGYPVRRFLSLSLSLSVSLETQRTLASLRVAPSTARWPLSLSLSLSLSLLSGLSPPLVSSADGAPQGVQGSPESTPPPNDGPSVVSPRSWAPWWS